MKRPFLLVVLGAGFFLAPALNSQATLIALEQFNYGNTNGNLNTKGTDDAYFAGGWTGSAASGGGSTYSADGSLSNAAYTQYGFSAVGGRGRLGASAEYNRTLDTGISLDGDASYYFSFTLRAAFDAGGTFSSSLSLGSGTDNRVSFLTTKTGNDAGTFGVTGNFDSGTPVASGTVAINAAGTQVYFVVGRMTLSDSGQDTIEFALYTTATVPGSEAGVVWTSVSGDFADTGSLDNLRLAASSADGAIAYDEIRIGTTYADVVPEPSVAALLGAAAVLGFTRRRAGFATRPGGHSRN